MIGKDQHIYVESLHPLWDIVAGVLEGQAILCFLVLDRFRGNKSSQHKSSLG
ncbi:hypothetical protein LPB19_03250 [Marinobacter salinisoli]|uniref:Uncharacterized protein n=1 Tax=Marinobacter salinisoli TaxID=2769486 RepID=A0ABX7MTF5_9GAMM|nr:hypothetical protein [Marinobacter salinisoli]QSP95449.1 hypothetical protein LPB19_03250 [Marinobacter salinisoli]